MPRLAVPILPAVFYGFRFLSHGLSAVAPPALEVPNADNGQQVVWISGLSALRYV